MKIKALILVIILIIAAKAQSYEFKINRFNETLIVVNHPVLGVNCAPASLGKISGVEGVQNSNKHFFLKLTPKQRLGDLFCSFKLSNQELVDVKFELGDFIETPLVDITRSEKELITNDEFEEFIQFSRGMRSGYKNVINSDRNERVIKGGVNTYRLNELYMSRSGYYFYVFEILTGSTDKFLKLNNFSSNTLRYSSLIHEEEKTYLIISSSVLINFKKVLP